MIKTTHHGCYAQEATSKKGVDFRIFEYLDGDRREGGSQGWSPCRNIKSISISVCHLQIIIILCTCFSAPVSLHEGRCGIFLLRHHVDAQEASEFGALWN